MYSWLPLASSLPRAQWSSSLRRCRAYEIESALRRENKVARRNSGTHLFLVYNRISSDRSHIFYTNLNRFRVVSSYAMHAVREPHHARRKVLEDRMQRERSQALGRSASALEKEAAAHPGSSELTPPHRRLRSPPLACQSRMVSAYRSPSLCSTS